MRALANRIRRLECSRVVQPNLESHRLAMILYERRRLRWEREGIPAEQWPPEPMLQAGPTLSFAQTLQRRKELRTQLVERCRSKP